MANFGELSSFMLSSIFQQYCGNLYGIALCDVTAKMYSNLQVLWRKAIRRILRVPGRAHNRMLPLIFGISDLDTVCYKRIIRFYHCLLHSSNTIVVCLANRCMSKTMSNMGRNIAFMERKVGLYPLIHNSSCTFILQKLDLYLCNSFNVHVNDIDFVYSKLCIDTIIVRDGLECGPLTAVECHMLIEYLCTI